MSPLALARTARASRARSPGKPSKLNHIFLRGGIDPILTTDPKVKSQVAPDIDLPYGEDAILTRGSARFGLGATLLHWFGIEDTASYGYLGRRLDFALQ